MVVAMGGGGGGGGVNRCANESTSLSSCVVTFLIEFLIL